MFIQILRELTLIKEEDDKAAEGKGDGDDDFARFCSPLSCIDYIILFIII
jgi:hypothetical protein